MGKTKIEWTEQTWNPIVGCSKVSPGCANCYAERMANRLAGMNITGYCKVIGGDTRGSIGKWNGTVYFNSNALQKPLNRKKATTYFVCSMGDIFHESVPFEWIDKVWAVMALCPQHTFQVLTKRPERLAEYFHKPTTKPGECLNGKILPEVQFRVHTTALKMVHARHWTNQKRLNMWDGRWPLPNVWLGTTTENQEMANKRIPELLKCPAAKRFVSVEPMLGAVDLQSDIGGTLWMGGQRGCGGVHSHGHIHRDGTDGRYEHHHHDHRCGPGLDWVICGGESGPGARPMHPDWARSVRDQCKAAGVPFFFKQWGKYKNGRPWKIDGEGDWVWSERRDSTSCELSYYPWSHPVTNLKFIHIRPDGSEQQKLCWEPGDARMTPLGKKKAGSLLDGVQYKEMPI